MHRLELTRVRTCQRCGRGRADLRGEDGAVVSVPLDPLRVRELAGTEADGLRTLTECFVAQLKATGAVPREVVLDVADGRLRALLTCVRGGETDVIACTPEEGVVVSVRAELKLYATDEAIAHGVAPPDARGGGRDTIH